MDRLRTDLRHAILVWSGKWYEMLCKICLSAFLLKKKKRSINYNLCLSHEDVLKYSPTYFLCWHTKWSFWILQMRESFKNSSLVYRLLSRTLNDVKVKLISFILCVLNLLCNVSLFLWSRQVFYIDIRDSHCCCDCGVHACTLSAFFLNQ